MNFWKIYLAQTSERRYLFSTKSNKALISFVWPLAREEFNNAQRPFRIPFRVEGRSHELTMHTIMLKNILEETRFYWWFSNKDSRY